MILQAILWDLDGTLADTEALHFHAWRATLATHGIDYSFEEFRRGFGRTSIAVLQELLGPAATPEQVRAVAQEKETNTRRLIRQQGLQLLRGAGSWLDKFRQAGLRQALASSGPMGNIIAILDALDVGDYFESVLSGARLPRGKPDPALFLLAAASLEAAPEHCLVLEDSLAGVEAARRAAMRCVAVGQVIHNPALHEMLAAIPGPPVIQIEQWPDLAWEQIER
ncbi:MAG: beta-phosphoglucomutase [Chloroflexi bacterium]|nr:MAG: beta-phosphoglucomutase [Chloroflexota bacterium]